MSYCTNASIQSQVPQNRLWNVSGVARTLSVCIVWSLSDSACTDVLYAMGSSTSVHLGQ